MKRTMILLILAALVAGCGTVSTSGGFTLERGETLRGDLMVTSGRATLKEDSRVTGSVFLTSGSLELEAGAEISGNVLVTSGDVSLASGAVVRGDVVTTSGRINQAEGARIEGKTATAGADLSGNIFGAFCTRPIAVLGVFVLFIYWLFGLARRRPETGAASGRDSTLVVGVLLIVLGAVFFVQSVTDLDLGNWWALLILSPALGLLAEVGRSFKTDRRLTAAARGPLIGGLALLLISAIFLFDLSWVALWPLFIIIIGLGVLVAR